MKGMMKIPQEESDDKESKKESIYQNLKLKSLFGKDRAFLKIAFYFIIAHIIVILILTRNDMLKKSKNNGLSSEDMKTKVRLALYIHSLSTGEMEKLISILLNYLSNQSIFEIYLFINKDCKIEYKINQKIHKIKINIHSTQILRYKLIEYNIELFLYLFNNIKDIKMLNKLNELKDIRTIFINYSGFLYRVYNDDSYSFNTLYEAYKESKFTVSFIPFENELLFKNWGIDSIFMDVPLKFFYNNTFPSDLSSKTILMMGKGSEHMKRLDLGIKTMKYIVKEIPDCKMKIITDIDGKNSLKKLSRQLDLENNIVFEEYTSFNEIHFKNVSLHLMTSIAERSGMDVCETKLFGIPNVLVGLDYLPCSKGGVSIIYDDNPKEIAEECIDILRDKAYREQMGKEAREAMKNYDVDSIADKWMRLLLCAYLDETYYHKIKEEDNDLINLKDEEKILNNQIDLLKKRIKRLGNINSYDLKKFSFIKRIYKLKSGFISFLNNFF